MKHTLYSLLCLLLPACSKPVIDMQHVKTVDGNKLQITQGTFDGGRFVTVENVDKRWVGRMKGGKEKWGARKTLLEDMSTQEIRSICGTWHYMPTLGPFYNMLDKDETMGGVAPVLGITASMAAYVAAASSTDEANIPTSVYTEFRCHND